MENIWTILGLVVLCCTLAPVRSSAICDFYEFSKCKAAMAANNGSSVDLVECRVSQKICATEGDHGKYRCYTFWEEHTEGLAFKMKGCWHEEPRCNQSACVDQSEPRMNPVTGHSEYFCCCQGNNCNTDISPSSLEAQRLQQLPNHKVLELQAASPTRGAAIRPTVNTTKSSTRGSHEHQVPVEKGPSTNGNMLLAFILGSVAIAIVLGVAIACFAYKIYRRRMIDKKKPRDLECTVQCVPLMAPEYDNQEGVSLLKTVQLLEKKSAGRYSAVWKGKIGEVIVAVKVTPMAEASSWANEVEIYKRFLPNPHANILRCLMSSDGVGDGNLLLLTEYHPLGSLLEVLKGRVISVDDAEKIMCSMMAGLAYLHESDGKPAIAHRDFKSTNVLIKTDGTACVADFGLATAFEPNERIGDKHGQVGTRRYMAPELLEGAITLSVVSFLRVDMYACGLVLWEILSRTRLTPEEPVGLFRLPFEEELGLNPDNEAVQRTVVRNHIRPALKQSWKDDLRTAGVILTIEECWDSDPEARPSASCLLNRARRVSHSPSEGACGQHRFEVPATVGSPVPSSVC